MGECAPASMTFAANLGRYQRNLALLSTVTHIAYTPQPYLLDLEPTLKGGRDIYLVLNMPDDQWADCSHDCDTALRCCSPDCISFLHLYVEGMSRLNWIKNTPARLWIAIRWLTLVDISIHTGQPLYIVKCIKPRQRCPNVFSKSQSLALYLVFQQHLLTSLFYIPPGIAIIYPNGQHSHFLCRHRKLLQRCLGVFHLLVRFWSGSWFQTMRHWSRSPGFD